MDKIKKLYIENEEIIRLLEKLQYESESRKEVLGYIISTNGVNTEAFKQYEKEYQDAFINFNAAKNEFEKEYVKPAVGEGSFINWTLDYNTQEVTITLI